MSTTAPEHDAAEHDAAGGIVAKKNADGNACGMVAPAAGLAGGSAAMGVQTQPQPQPDGGGQRPLRVCWLGGWGVAPEALLAVARRLLPAAEHRVFAPTQENLTHLQTLAQARPQAVDVFAAYSTGAFLLLREAPRWERCPPLRLFAPFLDFRAEAGLGGRVVATRLKLLLRRLRTAALDAVADFYRQSGIALAVPQTLPYAAEDLLWGIEQLAQTSVDVTAAAAFAAMAQQMPEPAAGWAAGADFCRAWIGGEDALLEGTRIASLLPCCECLPFATHDFESLLGAALSSGGVL